jgi:hypothetical protein
MGCGDVVRETADPSQTESDDVMPLFDDFERKSRADDVGIKCFMEEFVRILAMDALPFSARLRAINSLDRIGSSWHDVIVKFTYEIKYMSLPEIELVLFAQSSHGVQYQGHCALQA